MALKVNKEYGVTIKGKAYPLGATVTRDEKNAAEVDALLAKGYVIDTASTTPPKAVKDKGGK